MVLIQYAALHAIRVIIKIDKKGHVNRVTMTTAAPLAVSAKDGMVKMCVKMAGACSSLAISAFTILSSGIYVAMILSMIVVKKAKSVCT